MLPHTNSGGGGGGQEQPSAVSVDGRPPKRQKIGIACNMCKYRKSKCDGVRPVCGGCAKRPGDQLKCVYRDAASFGSAQPQLLPSTAVEAPNYSSSTSQVALDNSPLAARPRSLNHTNYSQSPPGWLGLDQQIRRHEIRPILEPHNGEGETVGSGITFSERIDNDPRRPSIENGETDSDDNADAMGCVDSWALRVGQLGASSGASFLQHVINVADGDESLNHGHRGSTTSSYVSHTLRSLGKATHSRDDLHAADYVLPLRKTADYLLNIYWESAHSVFPFLNKFEFEKSYSKLWTGADSVQSESRVFHCILNVMFAIGCKLDQKLGSKDQPKHADAYFKRARYLLTSDLLEINQFPFIQALLLMVQYLQSTNMARQCFRSLGLAIWIAQDLGLHMPDTIFALADLREQELAKRIWHSCILLDRVLAMVYGRPVRISQEVAALAPPLQVVDDEFFETTNGRPSSQPTQIEFFIQYCKLHYILGDMLPEWYSNSGLESVTNGAEAKPRLFTSDLQTMIGNDERLDRWKRDLPNHLQVSSHINERDHVSSFYRQANMLYLKYLYIRLLTLRMTFLRGTHLLVTSPDDERITTQIKYIVVCRCISLCIETAEKMIDFIHERVFDENLRKTLPSWWYSVTYVYTSATVLIASYRFLSYLEGKTESMLATSIQKSYDVLQYFEPTTPSAGRCMSALQSTYSKIVPTEARNLAFQEMAFSMPKLDMDPAFNMNATPRPMAEANTGFFPMFDSQDVGWLNNGTNYWDFSLWQ